MTGTWVLTMKFSMIISVISVLLYAYTMALIRININPYCHCKKSKFDHVLICFSYGKCSKVAAITVLLIERPLKPDILDIISVCESRY